MTFTLMFLILRKMESKSFFMSTTIAVCFLKSVVALSSLGGKQMSPIYAHCSQTWLPTMCWHLSTFRWSSQTVAASSSEPSPERVKVRAQRSHGRRGTGENVATMQSCPDIAICKHSLWLQGAGAMWRCLDSCWPRPPAVKSNKRS